MMREPKEIIAAFLGFRFPMRNERSQTGFRGGDTVFKMSLKYS